jgi:uncharacterized protein YukE
MNKLLLHFARKVVESVLNELKKILDDIRDWANDPIKAIIQTVTGGVWRGEGANAFVEELQKLVIPKVDHSCTCIQETHQHIQNAIQTLDQADTQARDKIIDLGDQFDRIWAQ